MEDDVWKHGRFFWNELMTRDATAACRFYAEMLGWQYQKMTTPDGHHYWLALVDEQPAAGIMDMTASEHLAELPPHWFSYISVNDIDDRLTNLSDHGGILLRPPFDVDDVGRFAVIQDPSGGVVGWITPSNNA